MQKQEHMRRKVWEYCAPEPKKKGSQQFVTAALVEHQMVIDQHFSKTGAQKNTQQP